jgi:hypothetical protein
MSGPWILRLMLPAWPRLVPSRTSFGLPRLGCDNLSRPLGDELHIRRVATSLASEPGIASPWMERSCRIMGRPRSKSER